MCSKKRKISSELLGLYKKLKKIMLVFAIITIVFAHGPLAYIFLFITYIFVFQFLRQAVHPRILKILSILVVTTIVFGWIGINIIKDYRKAQGILFPPAKKGELLFILAQFNKRGEFGLDPTTRIVAQLQAAIKKADIQFTRIETVPKISKKEEARNVGDIHDAIFVIWGWYDDAGFNPNFTIIRERLDTKIEIEEIPSELKDFNLYIREGLPAHMSYLATLTIGQLYYWNNEYDQALSTFKTATKILENSPSIKGIRIPGGLEILYYYQANIHLKKGNPDKAISDYNKSIELKHIYAEVYNNRGLAYQKKGNLDKAISDYNKSIELRPNSAVAYNNRGTAYLKKSILDKAISDFDKVIEFNPKNAEAYSNRATAYLGKGSLDKAISDCNKAIELKPKNAEAYYNRGTAYWDKGNFDKAISDFDKAIEFNPKNAEAYNNRGNAYLKKSILDKAISDYNKAIEHKPKFALTYYNRGLAYQKKGNLDKAISDYNKSIELDSEYANAYKNRGIIYVSKKLKDLAVDDFEMYLHLLPNALDRMQVKQLIQRLKKI